MAPRTAAKSKPFGPPVFMSIPHYTRRAFLVKGKVLPPNNMGRPAQQGSLPPNAQQPFGAEHRPAGRQRHGQKPGAQVRQKHRH